MPGHQALDRRLREHGVDLSPGAPSSAPGVSFVPIWEAFTAFLQDPLAQWYEPLRIPASKSTDRAVLQTVWRRRRPTPNRPARPPVVYMYRQIYLVDERDDWRQTDEIGLKFELSYAVRGVIEDGEELTVSGRAGPSMSATGAEGERSWVEEVVSSRVWPLLTDHWIGSVALMGV